MNNKVILHSYKHDGTLHRVWKNETILDETNEYIIIANKRTRVVESTGRFWYTREPSVAIFFKNHWFNVIGIIKKTGLCFYCNLSSPILQDDEALKYIDYDLDVKVNEDFTYNIHELS
jgi:protein associated with RNAse G/E